MQKPGMAAHTCTSTWKVQEEGSLLATRDRPFSNVFACTYKDLSLTLRAYAPVDHGAPESASLQGAYLAL